MNSAIYRILGKRGRITIPYELRQQVGFGYNDILSFTRQEDNSVVVRREKICDHCAGTKAQNTAAYPPNMTLMELLDGLTPSQQYAALVHLTQRWAEQQDKKNPRRAAS